MRITHFDIITEYIIESNLQTRNTRFLTFPLLHLQQIILTGISNGTQFIQFRIDTFSYHTTFIQQSGRVVIDFFLDTVTYFGTGIQLLTDTGKARFVAGHTGFLYRFDCPKSNFQLHHFPGRNTAYRYL